ncbi:unnamed protein product [Allacma fusca]|uniref:Uncharacterized protein n=1 Tax=Allacma fusca TaxID=39272 RepID=A0A8J2MCN4_9HEXA|nr:unnamed protein product [Allacma fusca]
MQKSIYAYEISGNAMNAVRFDKVEDHMKYWVLFRKTVQQCDMGDKCLRVILLSAGAMGCMLTAPFLVDHPHKFDPWVVGPTMAAHSSALPHRQNFSVFSPSPEIYVEKGGAP